MTARTAPARVQPSDRSVERAETALAAAARGGLPWEEFGLAAMEIIADVIPHDAICIATTDPATRLLTGTVKSGIDGSADDRFVRLEYRHADVNHFRDLARRPTGVGILAQETGGDPQRSTRYRELLRPHYGLEHELRGVARLNDVLWGTCALYRDARSPAFSNEEASALDRFEEALALGVRNGLLASALANRSESDDEPAVLLMDGDGQVVQATNATAHRMAELGGDLWTRVPTSIAAVTEAARALDRGASDQAAYLRTRTRSGEWLTVKAATVHSPDQPDAGVAVTIERADAGHTLPLLIDAYGLSTRESEIVLAVTSGASTREIAANLHIAAYTVQDHLKSIFGKVGVSTRRELSALLNGKRPIVTQPIGSLSPNDRRR